MNCAKYGEKSGLEFIKKIKGHARREQKNINFFFGGGEIKIYRSPQAGLLPKVMTVRRTGNGNGGVQAIKISD